MGALHLCQDCLHHRHCPRDPWDHSGGSRPFKGLGLVGAGPASQGMGLGPGAVGARGDRKRLERNGRGHRGGDVAMEGVSVSVMEPWPRLPREAVESPSLEIFKPHLDVVLCSLLWVTLLGHGVGLGDPQRSLPTPAMLGFCECVGPWDKCMWGDAPRGGSAWGRGHGLQGSLPPPWQGSRPGWMEL